MMASLLDFDTDGGVENFTSAALAALSAAKTPAAMMVNSDKRIVGSSFNIASGFSGKGEIHAHHAPVVRVVHVQVVLAESYATGPCHWDFGLRDGGFILFP